jgi:hypothetical protein
MFNFKQKNATALILDETTGLVDVKAKSKN